MSTIAEQMAADTGTDQAAPVTSLAQQMAQDAGTTTAKATAKPSTATAKPITGPESMGPGMQTAANLVTGAGASVYGGLKGLGVLAKGLVTGDGVDKSLSDAAGVVTQSQQDYTYQPRDTSDQKISGILASGANPLNWPAMAGRAAGDKLAEVGHPVLATMADVAGNAAPMLLGTKPVRSVAGDAAVAVRDMVRPAAPGAPRVEPTMGPAVTNNPSPTLSQVVQGAPEAPNLSLAAQAPVPSKAEPYPATSPAPKPTFSDPENNVFADSAPDVKGGLPAADQARRAAVLKEVGIDQARASAVSGDANQAAVDFQTSRLKGSPAGDFMSQQLANEKQAISQYADNIVQNTGGSSLNDQSAKLARGNTILTPLEGLKEWYDNQTSALYKEADERAQGVPTQLDQFRSVLGDDSLATNSDRINLRSAIGAYANKLGIISDDGSVFANAQQAETMRKYLNENWSPQNSGLVGKLKDALDDDVMASAGEDIYGAARKLRAERARTLDDPNGVASILDTQGSSINRKVPVEKVSDYVANMPVAQLNHIVETLKNVPPELQPMAQDALAEIKAQYAHNVKDIGANQAGQWNAKGVQKYLSNNSARMSTVFEPDEMKSFGTLNDAGNILAKDQSYPGAFAQHQNLVRAGVSHGITQGMTAAGGAVLGAPGAVVGNIIGGRMAGRFNDASTLRAAQKRMVNVNDMLPK